MRLVIQTPAGAIGPSRVAVTVHTADGIPEQTWCEPCNRFHKSNGDGDNRIAITYTTTPPPKVYKKGHGKKLFDAELPCSVWQNANGEDMYVCGFYTLDQLWTMINKEDNNPPPPMSMAATGPAGAIHASAQIEQMFSFWRTHIGEGKTATFNWERSGERSLNLLHAKDWSATDIFGTTGRIDLSAIGAINLPVDKAGFSYRIVGEDVTIDADAVTIPGLTRQLGLSQQSSVMGATPSGIFVVDDLVLGWNVFSAIKGIMSLCWPSVDAQIPGVVTASAILDGDKLTVSFSNAPTVRIVCLFTFNLKIRSVEITEGIVKVSFNGSRFIQSRSFDIR